MNTRQTVENTISEEELIQRLLDKDPEALRILHTEYHSRVSAVVRRIIRDERDNEEVVQDTFWTVFRKIHLFRKDSALWSWIYRIAVNCAKMKVRKYKRIPIPMEDEVLHAVDTSSHEDRRFRPDERLNGKEIIREIQLYLDECDETNRLLYVQMELEGVPKEEVAERLNLTVPAVKTRLHRLRVGLRQRLEPMYAPMAV